MLGGLNPASETDPRGAKVSRFVAPTSGEHAWQCLISLAAQRPPHGKGGRRGSDGGTRLRPRCASGDGGGVSVDRPAGAAATEGDPQLPNDDGGAAEDAAVVAGERLHARRDGEYWGLLAAGLCGA